MERAGERQIRLNEGFAVQSFSRDDGGLPVRDVWTYYALAPRFASVPAPRNVLLLGLGGGTSAEIYRRLYPEANLVGVELDPMIVEAGRKWLGVKLDDVEVAIEDARTFVEAESSREGPRFDVIVLDAFRFPYVPFQLTTVEFFARVRQCLAPGGVLMVNAGRYGEERSIVHAVARTMGRVFARVDEADAPNRSNTLLLAADHPSSEDVGIEGLAVPSQTKDALRALSSRTASMRPAAWPTGTPVLTDDRAPVEWLTDRIVWRAL